MKKLLILALPAMLVLGLARPTSATAGNGIEFTQLSLGKKTAVTGNFAVNGMSWANTQHTIELADGRIKKNSWYEKRLGTQFSEVFNPDFSVSVRYNCIGFPGPDIAAITVKIKDAGQNLLCKETYRVQ